MINKTKTHAIYQPEGVDRECAQLASDLYDGCSYHCPYCLWTLKGVKTPVIKAQLGGSPEAAYDIFCQDLDIYHARAVADGGLLFSLHTDPMLREEIDLTMRCVMQALSRGVPVRLLTKSVWWVKDDAILQQLFPYRDLLHIGFTLERLENLAPKSPTTSRRQNAMMILHTLGFDLFASMHPIWSFEGALAIIMNIASFCPEFRIGLPPAFLYTGYEKSTAHFVREVVSLSAQYGFRIIWYEPFKQTCRDFGIEIPTLS